jgi:heme/copper-type cytochrome/quinol oxidase subunit 2
MRRSIPLWKIVAVIVGGLTLTLAAAFLAIRFVQAPIAAGTIDPLRLNKTEFRDRGLFKTGDSSYLLRLIAKEWVFDAGQQRDQRFAFTIPVGSTVTIVATSMDVMHTLQIGNKPAIPIIAGKISRSSITFTTPGTYAIRCTSYCGPNHAQMTGSLIVIP